jgi:hypothetical protein
VIRAAKMKPSAISATTDMQMSVNGQCESVNASNRMDGGTGGTVMYPEDVSDDNDSLPGN